MSRIWGRVGWMGEADSVSRELLDDPSWHQEFTWPFTSTCWNHADLEPSTCWRHLCEWIRFLCVSIGLKMMIWSCLGKSRRVMAVMEVMAVWSACSTQESTTTCWSETWMCQNLRPSGDVREANSQRHCKRKGRVSSHWSDERMYIHEHDWSLSCNRIHIPHINHMTCACNMAETPLPSSSWMDPSHSGGDLAVGRRDHIYNLHTHTHVYIYIYLFIYNLHINIIYIYMYIYIHNGDL